MFLWLKRLSGSMADGRWFSARPEIDALDPARDAAELERLLADHGAPFGPTDVAGWVDQEGSVALRARLGDRFAGAFVGRRLGGVAHVDLVAVTAELRQASVARPLFFTGVNRLAGLGAHGVVAHARPPAGALLELAGYTAGLRFVDLSAEVGEVTVSGGHRGELVDGSELAVGDLGVLDREVFGVDRTPWLRALSDRPDVAIHAFLKGGAPIAALALQRVPGGDLRLRLAEGREFRDLSSLLHVVLVMNSGKRVTALAREGGKLEAMLGSMGFEGPDGAEPWVEYRSGRTAGVGDGDGVHHLAWW